jgi:hypothetical protein
MQPTHNGTTDYPTFRPLDRFLNLLQLWGGTCGGGATYREGMPCKSQLNNRSVRSVRLVSSLSCSDFLNFLRSLAARLWTVDCPALRGSCRNFHRAVMSRPKQQNSDLRGERRLAGASNPVLARRWRWSRATPPPGRADDGTTTENFETATGSAGAEVSDLSDKANADAMIRISLKRRLIKVLDVGNGCKEGF